MQTRGHTLADGQVLIVREAEPDDARAALAYVDAVGAESDFLTFAPGEFGYTEAQERAYIADSASADHRLFVVGEIDDVLVSLLGFSGGERPRLRHTGEFGLSVRKAYWGMGIGGLMVDTLVRWAQEGGIIRKINLRVRTDHSRAIALYQRKGFAIEGTITRAVRVKGQDFDQHWMGLQI